MTQSFADKITLKSVIRDFRADHPDFENDQQTLWNRYTDLSLPEKGIVAAVLGSDNKPVYIGDAQSGTQTTSGKVAFDQWYRDDKAVNCSVELPLELKLDHTAEGSAQYKYESDRFFPLDARASTFGNLHDEVHRNGGLSTVIAKNLQDPVKKLGYIEKNPGEYLTEADIKGRFDSQEAKTHNYHFTQEISTTFVYQGSEHFEFQGDDDLWVFINGKLVVDLGGLHASAKARVDLSLENARNRAADNSQALTLRLKDDLGIGHADEYLELFLEVGKAYDIHIFHAERHTFDSNFNLYTSIQLKPTVIEPEVIEPEVIEPEAKIPEPEKPEPGKPKDEKPEARKPEAKDPDARHPEGEKPEAKKPEAKKPDVKQPDLESYPSPVPIIPGLPENVWDIGERIVCVAPVRTIVRREEEITIIRRVRKVEEVDASPTCPVGTTPISEGQMSGVQQDT
ncbi:MAG: fibro-slime domain-containing protein [Cyanobacteria bacterium P01_D01_bin.105]